MTSPMRARLGSHGRAVHALEFRVLDGNPTGYWGVSICRQADGEARLTEEPVTCGECRRLLKEVKP